MRFFCTLNVLKNLKKRCTIVDTLYVWKWPYHWHQLKILFFPLKTTFKSGLSLSAKYIPLDHCRGFNANKKSSLYLRVHKLNKFVVLMFVFLNQILIRILIYFDIKFVLLVPVKKSSEAEVERDRSRTFLELREAFLNSVAVNLWRKE